MNSIFVNWDDLDINDAGYASLSGVAITGTAIELDSDGGVVSTVEFVNGERHGWSKTWYANGNPLEQTLSYKFISHGPQRSWHENGQIEDEDFSVYGFRISRKHWNESGDLLLHEEVPEDAPHRIRAIRFSQRLIAEPERISATDWYATNRDRDSMDYPPTIGEIAKSLEKP